MNAKQIVHCVLQIEKLNAERTYSDVLVLLSDLDKLDITAEQLETTDIVKVLYRVLKSCKDDNVKKTARGLLSKWKRRYCKERGDVLDEGCSSQTRLHEKTDVVWKCETESSLRENDQVNKAENSPGSSSFPSVRSKCVQLLLSALCLSPADQDKASNLAAEIERHIYERHKPNQVKYKTCVRSKIANLKNTKSSHLKEGLLDGSLSPEVFARMSAEDMASADLRRLREEYSCRSVNERQLPQNIDGTPTQKIRCKRCEGTDCRVTQVSRGTLFLPAWVRQGGPDDDSMTFVTCGGCGQQWYHNNWVCL